MRKPYLLKGPTDMDMGNATEAIKQGREILYWARDLVNAIGECTDKSRLLLDKSLNVQCVKHLQLDQMPFVAAVLSSWFSIDRTIESFVDEFRRFWKAKWSRDSVWREDPDDPTSTWVFTNAPSEVDIGFAYQVFRVMDYLNWFELFNLR